MCPSVEKGRSRMLWPARRRWKHFHPTFSGLNMLTTSRASSGHIVGVRLTATVRWHEIFPLATSSILPRSRVDQSFRFNFLNGCVPSHGTCTADIIFRLPPEKLPSAYEERRQERSL